MVMGIVLLQDKGKVDFSFKPFLLLFFQYNFKNPEGHNPKDLVIHRGGNPNKCRICGLQTAGNMARHMRRHTGERPYKCQYCPAAFAQQSCLTRHIRTHTGERPYRCRVCDRRFVQSGTLYAHMLTHYKPPMISKWNIQKII
jgi:uncharacterized Zn-finger protein